MEIYYIRGRLPTLTGWSIWVMEGIIVDLIWWSSLEYNGFRDTKITIDSSKRDLGDLDINLYQSAFRFTRDFLNSTLHANYLAIINGIKLDKGGFQRAWVEYDIDDTAVPIHSLES